MHLRNCVFAYTLALNFTSIFCNDEFTGVTRSDFASLRRLYKLFVLFSGTLAKEAPTEVNQNNRLFLNCRGRLSLLKMLEQKSKVISGFN